MLLTLWPCLIRGAVQRRRTRQLETSIQELEERFLLTNVSGDIPNGTVWLAGEVQRITGDVRIPLGSTLTIQPGAVIKFNNSSDIDFIVDGTLLAQGTAEQPIVFTELRDDTGGDTNGDGAASGPSRANWGALLIQPGSTGSILDHFELRYGGWRADAGLVVNGGQLTFTNGVVRDADFYGVKITNASPTLTNIAYIHNGFAAVTMDLNSAPVISGVTMTNNVWNGLWLDVGTLSGNATWNNPDIVYILPGDVTVPQGKTLTLGAGQIIKTGFRTELFVNGTLIANGTAADPVIFANPSDDTAGGDTNNNGTANNASSDASGGIVFSNTSTGNALDHVEVRHSGFDDNAAIMVNGSSITLTNSVIRNSIHAGIRLTSSTAVITGNVFQDNTWEAIVTDLASSLTANGNTLSNNGRNGVLMLSGTLSADATWNNPDIVYFMQDDITVPQGKTLTIGAGQIIKSGFRTELFVNGTLLANGSSAAPVIFANPSDDTAGGDTNNNGTANNASSDASGGIVFSASSIGSVLDHVEVRHSGFDDNGAIMVNGASITLTNSVIRDAVHAGIWMNAGTMAISNTDFQRNTWLAIAADVASNVTSGGGNTFSQNPVNGLVVLSGSLPANASWNNPDITYALDGNGAGVTIPVGVTLTLGAGQIIKVGNRREAFIVNGTLKALGTAAAPVICTSFDDDSVGGDSFNNGTNSGPNPGDWGAWTFTASSTNSVLDHVQLRYGQNPDFGARPGMINVTGSALTISHSVIANAAQTGIGALAGATLTLTDSTIVGNHSTGIRVEGSSLTASGVTLQNNSGDAIRINLNSDVNTSDMTATGNGRNAIFVDGGTMAANHTWGGAGLPFQLDNDVTLASAAGLTLASGAVFKATEGDDLNGPGTVFNAGTIHKQSGAGTATISAPVVNTGLIKVGSGILCLAGGVANNGIGVVDGPIGTTLAVGGGLTGDTHNVAGFDAQVTTLLNGSGTVGSPQLLEALSADKGSNSAGFDDNFAYFTLSLSNNTYVKLVDNSNNVAGAGAEAVYVQNLLVPAGTTLDLNGLHLYARSTAINGTMTGGLVSVVPDGGPLTLDKITSGKIAAAGEIDDWTVFGRAGQTLTFTLGTGGGSATPPIAPTLNFAQLQVIAPGGGILGTVANSSSGVELSLAGITLPTDGVYHIKVQAAPAQANSTGNYVLTAWNATINTQSIELNQTVTGDIDTPFRVDRWTFSAAANQVLAFDLINAESPNVQFDLTGPNGFTLFSNLSASLSGITLPAAGNYAVTVHTAQRQTGAYAFRLEPVSVTTLTLGTPYTGQLAGSGQSQLFKLNVPTLQQLQVLLTDTSSTDRNEVYLKLGSAPTRSDYQYKFNSPASADQQIDVPSAAPGDWYILVYTEAAANPGTITLLTKGASVFLTSVTPDHAGNGADMTLTLAGIGFDNTTSVSLISASNAVFTASTVNVDLPTLITATFNAGSVPPGTYAVRLNKSDGGSSTLSGAFTVLAGGEAKLETNVLVPDPIGLHIASTIYVQYSNTGDIAMPAPLLVLSAVQNGIAGAYLTLDQALQVSGFWTSATPAGYSHEVQILASGATPGVLQPGESVSVPVYYAGWQQDLWDFSRPPIYFTLGTLTTESTASVDWASLKSTLRPSDISNAAWDGIYSNLTSQLGTTWGNVIQRLNQDAAYLGRLGEQVTDISQLWSFEIQQANGISLYSALSTATDMTMGAVGLPLLITRAIGNTVVDRNLTGPFGYGWRMTGGWGQTLTVATDGTVSIADGGITRVFQPDSRGNGYFSAAGNHGSLTNVGGGFYTLTTPDGLVTTFQNGQVAYLQDANGNRITAAYTGGRLTSLTASTGQSITVTYNGAGRITELSNSMGQTAHYTYDASNQYLLTATDQAGMVTTYAYDMGDDPATQHALTRVTASSGAQQLFSYDSRGRLSVLSAAGGALATHFSYGTAATVMSTNSANDTTTYFFNQRSQLAKVVDPLQRAMFYAYDASGNLVRVTNPAGEIYAYTYDSHGRQIQSTNPLGNVTKYSYSALNRVSSVTDPKGNTTGFQHDQHGNLISTVYADGTIESLAYNPLGEVTSRTDGNKNVTNYAYNSAGQLLTTTYADSSQTIYGYDSLGNLTSAVDSTGTTILSYDAAGRLLQITYPDDTFLKYSYDASGRRKQMLDQTGFTVNYAYDALGRVSGLTDGTNGPIVSYIYDAVGRLQQETKGNGTKTSYAYDEASQLVSISNQAPDGAVSSSFVYTYNNIGLCVTETTLLGEWIYTYDATGQLTHAVFTSNSPGQAPDQDLQYFYDASGNRTRTIVNGVTTDYSVDVRNEYTSVGSMVYTYDANGNRISQTDATGTTHYTYNANNQLVAVDPSVGQTTTIEYNVVSGLYAATVNGQETRYLTDGVTSNVFGEFGSDGTLQTHYTWGLGLVSQVSAANAVSYYDFDLRGSTVGMTNAAGNYVNTYSYAPFGSLLDQTTTLANPFQFVGKWDVMAASFDLNLMGARAYDPVLGQFVADDPLGVGGGDFNVRRYAGNNPVSHIDPLGTYNQDAAADMLLFATLLLVEVSELNSEMIAAEKEGDLEARDRLNNQLHHLFAIYLILVNELRKVGIDARPGNLNGSDPLTVGGGTTISDANPVLVGIGIVVAPISGGSSPTGPTSDFNNPTTEIPGGDTFSIPAPNPPMPTPPTDSLDSVATTPVNSHDPNDLTGPAGFGPEGFVADQGQPFPYRINFENSSTASAPAQRVTITNQLNANLDWSSFSLTGAGFGDIVIAIPPGSQFYQTTVPMMYNGVSFVVEVTLGIHSLTGVVYATFQSLNPETSLPPDVLTGFLPPEDETGRGMGFISYLVNVKPGLATGTQIRNVASIVFDTNPAITTDQLDEDDPSLGVDPTKQALNTIDAGGPTSSVTALPLQSTPSFLVSWSGTDDAGGSGIASYDIYVKDNGGGYTLWQAATALISATYSGQIGHTYSFYSVATDNVGHVEAAPEVADTTTTAANSAPVINDQVFNIAENSAANTAIGTVAASDPDVPTVLSYSITAGNAANKFTLDSATGVLKVAAGAVLDFETPSTYTLTVQVTDNGSPAKSSSAQITIQVTDVNEAPSIPTGQLFNVAGNALIGATIGNVDASDPDSTSPNNTKSFSISSGNTSGAFSISPSGQITVADSAALATLAGQVATLEVTVTDSGSPPLSATQTVSITVANVNSPPILANPGLAAVFIGKAKTPVNVVPTLTVTDADGSATLATIVISLTVGAAKKNPDVVALPGMSPLGTRTDAIINGRLQITITLNQGATNAAVQTMLQGMTFMTAGKGLKVLSRNFQLLVTDRTGLHSNLITQNVGLRKK